MEEDPGRRGGPLDTGGPLDPEEGPLDLEAGALDAEEAPAPVTCPATALPLGHPPPSRPDAPGCHVWASLPWGKFWPRVLP